MLKQINIFALETCSEEHICWGQEQTTGWKSILQQEVTVLQLRCFSYDGTSPETSLF